MGETLVHNLLYHELHWNDDKEIKVMFASPSFTPRRDREQIAKIMFEALNVSHLYMCDSGVLSLNSTGRLTGCAVDVGAGKIAATPVINGELQTGEGNIKFGLEDL